MEDTNEMFLKKGVYASICNCDSAHCGSDSAAGDLDLI